MKPPLKVMVPLHSFAPGGVERVALRLCGAWATDPRIEVQLVMGRETGAMAGEAPAGLARHVTPAAFDTAPIETLWMLWTLPGHIRRLRPDVIFAAGNTYAIIAVMMKLWLGKRCPALVLKISNDLVRRDMPGLVRWGYRRWLRIQGRYVDHVTGLAEPMRAEIAALMAMPDDRIHIIDDPALSAADLAALAAIGTARMPGSRGRHYVGIGRLAAQKNWGVLLKAFAQVAKRDDRLTILGEGTERGRLERQAAMLGIADRLALPGHGPASPVLGAGDVFVLSSDFEGVPAVVIEALASGLPVVATDCSVSMRALVGGFGTLVAVGDPPALGAAMAAQAPLTPATRAEAVAAMAGYTVERAARAYASLFHKAASRLPFTPAQPSPA